jgi:hypothetical protein
MLYVLLSGGTYSAERPSGKDGAVKSALNRRTYTGWLIVMSVVGHAPTSGEPMMATI